LKAAQANGPSHVKKAGTERAEFVVTFDRGSVVRMQALRATPSPAPSTP